MGTGVIARGSSCDALSKIFGPFYRSAMTVKKLLSHSKSNISLRKLLKSGELRALLRLAK